MLSSLLFLALLILPSAPTGSFPAGPSRAPETVEQKIDLVAEGVAALLFLPSALETVKQKIDSVAEEVTQTLEGSRHIARSVVDTNRDLEQLEAKTVSVRAQLETLLAADFTLQSTEIRELLAIVGATQNATSQLLTELDTLRGRQAVAAAVQVSQVLMFVVYLLTVLSIYVVKRCQKVREKSQRREFELLEKKLLSNKAKRRAAAAKEKSVPAPSKE